jgi:hypothetical protein
MSINALLVFKFPNFNVQTDYLLKWYTAENVQEYSRNIL